MSNVGNCEKPQGMCFYFLKVHRNETTAVFNVISIEIKNLSLRQAQNKKNRTTLINSYHLFESLFIRLVIYPAATKLDYLGKYIFKKINSQITVTDYCLRKAKNLEKLDGTLCLSFKQFNRRILYSIKYWPRYFLIDLIHKLKKMS